MPVGRPIGGPFDVDVLLWELKQAEHRIAKLHRAFLAVAHDANEGLLCRDVPDMARCRIANIEKQAHMILNVVNAPSRLPL